GRLVIALEYATNIRQGRLDLGAFAAVDLVTEILEGFLDGVYQLIGAIARIHQLAEFLVFFRVRFGVAHRALDLFLGQARRRLDGDLLFLARGLVFRTDVHDAVRVDVESDFDLRHAARLRSNVGEVELAERLVVVRAVTFTLQDVDGHRALVVVRGRERLRSLGRDRGVLLDELGHDAAKRLDAQRQWRHVEQQHVLHFTGEHTTLDGRANGDGFIGVHVLARILAEEFLHVLLHERHARLATDEDDLGDVLRADAGILERDA